MPLSVKEIVQLRGQAMRLKPMLKMGKHGLTDAVRKELKRLLAQHKLIKIRLEQTDRKERLSFGQALATDLGADFIGLTGRALVLFAEDEAVQS